jgi:anti-sigma factor RsiW
MDDREFIELVNADTDGVLDNPSRARLEQHLAEQPEAGRQRAELRALNN